MEGIDCFAYSKTNGKFHCSALNVKCCEYPKCKTYKTRQQVKEEKRKCRKRLNELCMK